MCSRKRNLVAGYCRIAYCAIDTASASFKSVSLNFAPFAGLKP